MLMHTLAMIIKHFTRAVKHITPKIFVRNMFYLRNTNIT